MTSIDVKLTISEKITIRNVLEEKISQLGEQLKKINMTQIFF